MTHLPAQVVIAAICTTADVARQTVVEGLAGIADVLATCRSATAVLAARADPADSAAYRQWLQSIAARVCAATRAGGGPAAGRERFSDAGQRFIGDLGSALSLP